MDPTYLETTYSFVRLTNQPLDKSSHFETYDDLRAAYDRSTYTGSPFYDGQIITVEDNANGGFAYVFQKYNRNNTEVTNLDQIVTKSYYDTTVLRDVEAAQNETIYEANQYTNSAIENIIFKVYNIRGVSSWNDKITYRDSYLYNSKLGDVWIINEDFSISGSDQRKAGDVVLCYNQNVNLPAYQRFTYMKNIFYSDYYTKEDSDTRSVKNYEYEPNIMTGAAKTVMGNAAEHIEISNDTKLPRTGLNIIDKIYGKSIPWNQLVNLTSINIQSKTVNGLTISATNGYITITGTASVDTSFLLAPLNNMSINMIPEHKYYFQMMGSDKRVLTFYFGSGIYFPYLTTIKSQGIQVGVNGGNIIGLYIRPQLNVTYNDSFYVQVIDLTKIFGAGNEPATVEEFKAIFPEDYYPYNPGEIINNKLDYLTVSNIDEEFSNILDLNVCSLTGKLNGTGESVTIFPNGMRSVGNIKDTIECDEDGYARKAIVRSFVFDKSRITSLGSSDANNYGAIRYVINNNLKAKGYTSFVSTLFIQKPSLVQYNDPAWLISGYAGSSNIYITLPTSVLSGDLTTAEGRQAAFYDWWDSVNPIIISELATPQIYTLDTPLPLTFFSYANSDLRQAPTFPNSTSSELDIVVPADMNKDYINEQSIDNFLTALGTAQGKTWTKQYDETTHSWSFSYT